MASVKEEEIQQASQKQQDLAENRSADCKVSAAEQSAAVGGKEESEPSWKEKLKIKTLEEIDALQKKQIEALKAELQEAEKALTNQKKTNCQLNKQVGDQEKKIRENDILKVELKKELKGKKASEKAMSEKLAKEHENLHALSVKFKDAQKEGCKVNRTLLQERRQGDRKEAELKEEIIRLNDEGAALQSSLTNLTNKITEQKTEIQQMRVRKEEPGDKFFLQEITIAKLEVRLGTMDARIGYMQLRHKTDAIEITSRRLQINDYKKAVSEINKDLKKTQKQRDSGVQILTAHLKNLRAESKRRGQINKANDETKATKKMDIRILYQLNTLLRHELTSSLIASYRAVKRFFGRAADAIRSLFW